MIPHRHAIRSNRRRFRVLLFGSLAAGLTFVGLLPQALGQSPAGKPAPIDPQQVQDQDDMTWYDYKPIPGVNWTDEKHKAEKVIKIALVVADFADQPFVVTLPKRSDLFGNPQIDPIPREQVAQFYLDFWAKAQELNHFHTVDEYWKELSHGRYGVQFDAYGPYRMPHKMIEYNDTVNGERGFGGGVAGGRAQRAGNEQRTAAASGGARGSQTDDGAKQADAAKQNDGAKQDESAKQDDGGQQAAAAILANQAQDGERGAGVEQGERGAGDAAGGDRRGRGGRGGGPRAPSLQAELDPLWRKDAGDKADSYNLVLRIYAGYDETCVWQEFGEMKFQTKDDIPPEWGNPDPAQPRWSGTRYIDWTSWKAGSYLWANSSIITGESSGAIRHEISHAAFAIGDNNNNPYQQPYHRVGSGPWDIMDRGSFNGPGGPHNRWQIPVQQGGSMPAGVMLSQQMKFGFIYPTNVVRLKREDLAKTGLVVAKVIPRNIDPGRGKLAGIAVALDGVSGDRTPAQDANTTPLYGGVGYNYYSMEVVQRTGYDSYSPDSGVLIAMNTGQLGDRDALAVAVSGRITGEGGRGGGRGARGRRGAPADGEPGAGDGAGERGAAGGDGARGEGAQADGERGGEPAGVGEGERGAAATRGEQAAAQPAANATGQVDATTPGGERGAGRRGGGARRGGGLARGGRGGRRGRGGGPRTLYFNWVIDAHPEDMNRVDFHRPNGDAVMRTIADYRQLNDALFHAGLDSGSQFEYVDKANGLHFYVIDLERDVQGIRTYTLGVRSLEGAGPQQRAVSLASPAAGGAFSTYQVTLTNTGTSAEIDPQLHLQDTRPYLDSDVYRLSVSAEGAGWTAHLQNLLATAKFGQSISIPVFVNPGSAPTATVTVKATSESNANATATTTFAVER